MAEDDEDDLGELLVAKERSTFTLRALIIALENVTEIMRRSSATKTVTEALLWRRWNHLKRCKMNGYINCELLKTYTTSRSTRCGWSKHTREHTWTRRHTMTHVLNERSHSTWSVRMVNGNCGAADRQEYVSERYWSLNCLLPTTEGQDWIGCWMWVADVDIIMPKRVLFVVSLVCSK